MMIGRYGKNEPRCIMAPPCPDCLRIAAQIAKDAKELEKAGVTFRKGWNDGLYKV